MTDPTGTLALRRSFLAEGNRRLAQLQSQTHGILVQHDLMAAKNDPLAQFLPHPGERLTMFTAWFETTAKRFLLGGWWERFLQRAYDSGATAGRELIGSEQAGFMAVPSIYRTLAAQEFTGITAAVVQQVTRQAGQAALGRLKPMQLYRAVLMALRRIGNARLKLAVNTMTVQLHNAARLSAYRAAGIRRIGIDPELLEPMRPSRFLKHDHQHDHLVLDDARRDAAEAEVRAAEARVAAAEAKVIQTEAVAAQAEAKSEVADLKVQTEENEVSLVEGEVAQADANLAAIESGDPDAPNYEARVAQANVQVERADAKLARAEDRLAAAQSAADEAENEASRTEAEAETAREDLAEAEAALEEAQAKLDALEETEGMVNVLTAGDDKVCNVCQDLAADGPYVLEESEGLLPAHPNCRCAWIPIEEPADAG